MKKIIYIIGISLSSLSYSQVRIGEKTQNPLDQNMSSPSVLLEFGDTKDRGIILPYVETVPSGTNDAKGGTLIFDISTTIDHPNGEFKVKVKNENADWTDLSVQSGYTLSLATDVKNPQALPLSDKAGAKAVIGNKDTTTDGVLVLDSDDKAMVLPIVEDYKAIKNPSAGMMAFLKHPTDNSKHRLIVFNGQKWTFWEAL